LTYSDFSNVAPVATVALPDVVSERTVDLSLYFTDANANSLTYSFTNSDEDVLNATLSGTNMTLKNGLFRDGIATITVTAVDPFGSNVKDEFVITFRFFKLHMYTI
jgi:hypothetical protein